MKKLILASTSPRRRAILKEFKIPFRVVPPLFDEAPFMKDLKNKNPYETAVYFAYKKAGSVLPLVRSGLILGSDTIVVLDGHIMGKPGTKKNAEKMLSRLSGSVHSVISGIALIDAASGSTAAAWDESRIYFKKMTKKQIQNYVENNHVLDKAGSYAIQEGADPYISKTQGSYYNIVGLPVEKLKRLIEEKVSEL
ncbi:MAG: Maf family protein [Candidatus Goldiibacteriota bacterium]